MTQQQAIQIYKSFGLKDQLRFLVRLGSWVTVVARADTYVPQSVEVSNGPKLRELTEVQHWIWGQCVKLVEDDPERYPDDVFMQMMWASAKELHIPRFGDLLEETQKRASPRRNATQGRRKRSNLVAKNS
jgi:hypothetical protein